MSEPRRMSVRAKIDAGYHPGLRTTINAGDELTIDSEFFSDELFEELQPATAAKRKGK